MLLAGCAGNGSPVDRQLAEMGLQRGENNSRLPIFRVNGWHRLNDSTLVVTTGVNNYWLISLAEPCPSTNGAFRIGFVTPTDSTDRFESLLVRSPGQLITRCDIADITRLYSD